MGANGQNERCSARLSDGDQCPNKAKVVRDGKPYCGIHDPVHLQAVHTKNIARRAARKVAKKSGGDALVVERMLRAMTEAIAILQAAIDDAEK